MTALDDFEAAMGRADFAAAEAALQQMDPDRAYELREMLAHARGYALWVRYQQANRPGKV